MNKSTRTTRLWVAAHLILMAGLLGAAHATDATPVAMLTQVTGTVLQNHPTSGKVHSFAKLPAGVEIEVKDNAQLRLIYLGNNRQEHWKGPARLRLGTTASQALGGTAQVSKLPSQVTQQLVQLDPRIDLASIQRGGVTLSKEIKLLETAPTNPLQIPQHLTRAHAHYRQLRQDGSDDDWTPELYWLSTLQRAGEKALFSQALTHAERRFPQLSVLFSRQQP
jgi:hypothetical protein